jgi:hypothetical protein
LELAALGADAGAAVPGERGPKYLWATVRIALGLVTASCAKSGGTTALVKAV